MTPDRSISPEIKEYPLLTMPDAESAVLPLSSNIVKVVRGDTEGLTQLDIVMPFGNLDDGNMSVPTLAHELLREGTDKWTSNDIANFFDDRGAWFKTDCQDRFVSLKLLALKKHYPELLSILGDMILGSTYSGKALDRLKTRKIKEVDVRDSRISFLSESLLRKLLYGINHPAAQDISSSDIKRVTPETARNFIINQFSYKPVGITIAGNIDDNIIKTLDDLLYRISPDSKPSREAVRIPYSPADPGISYTYKAAAHQSVINLGIPLDIDRYNKDYPHLRMAVQALGGYFGSRLMTDIREKRGLTYNISSSLSVSLDGAYMSVTCSTTPENVEEVIERIKAGIVGLIDNPPSGEELQTLKLQSATYYAQMADSTFSRASYHTLPFTLKIPKDYFFRLQNGIKTITPEIISNLTAKHLLPDNLRISVAAPK